MNPVFLGSSSGALHYLSALMPEELYVGLVL